jgi:hypothetical protein
MPSGPGNGRDDVFTDLGGQRLELIVAEAAQVAGSLQGGQDGQLHMLLGGSPDPRPVLEAPHVEQDDAFCLSGSLPCLRVGADLLADGSAEWAATAYSWSEASVVRISAASRAPDDRSSSF